MWPNVVSFFSFNFSFFNCIASISNNKDDLTFPQFYKIINLTRILRRYIGRVGVSLLHTRISSLDLVNCSLN